MKLAFKLSAARCSIIINLRHRFARFIIELAFIYNDADYMAE